jgi:hypothetical protein
MKLLLQTFLLFAIIFQINAQVQNHDGINFQGIARDAQGAPVASKKIKVKAGIAGPTDTLTYVETHEVTTDQFGLFSVSLGEGTVTEGDFSKLNWSGDFAYSLVISIDPTGGNNFTLVGTSVLKSVPYAKYADKAGNAYWQRGTQSSISYSGSVGVNCSQEKVLFATAGTPTTQGIFGLTGAGVSLQQNWPGIGFNHYYKDGQKSISKGYGGYIGVDPVNGGMFFRTISNAAGADQPVVLQERMFIAPTGGVGIGIPENGFPLNTIDVGRPAGLNGTALLRGSKYNSSFNSGNTEDTYISGGKDGGVVYLNPGNIGNVSIVRDGGKVGIGMEAPQATIDVNKGTNNAAGIFRGSSYPSRFAYSTNEDTYLRGGKNGGAVYINDLNIGNVYMAAAGGKVGIGTETPTATLDVARGTGQDGTAIFRGTKNVSHFNYSTSENTYIRGGKDSSKVYINDNNIGDVLIVPDGGHVGIGSDPSSFSKVFIEPDKNISGLAIVSEIEFAGPLTAGLYVVNHGKGYGGRFHSPNGTGLTISGKDAALTASGLVDVSGDLKYSGVLAQSSDIRFKSKIIHLSSSLSKVLKLNGVNYFYKASEFPDKNFSKSLQIGFIAQEVKEVVPEIVTEDKDGYLSVDYSKVTPLLVEAMKEQNTVIENQKTEIEMLKKELDAVKNQNTSLVEDVNTIKAQLQEILDHKASLK